MLGLNLHAERFVSLLEAAHGEELERVHVVTEVELALLPDPQRSRGHKRVPLRNFNILSFQILQFYVKFLIKVTDIILFGSRSLKKKTKTNHK